MQKFAFAAHEWVCEHLMCLQVFVRVFVCVLKCMLAWLCVSRRVFQSHQRVWEPGGDISRRKPRQSYGTLFGKLRQASPRVARHRTRATAHAYDAHTGRWQAEARQLSVPEAIASRASKFDILSKGMSRTKEPSKMKHAKASMPLRLILRVQNVNWAYLTFFEITKVQFQTISLFS